MINKLVEKIRKTNAPIVVGLDPMLDFIPESIKNFVFENVFPSYLIIKEEIK